jgi:two-component system, chemotaxis family, response regulator Rcp1
MRKLRKEEKEGNRRQNRGWDDALFNEGVKPVDAANSILLVEDNPADQRLTAEALKEGGWDGELILAEDGVEALTFLKETLTSPEARPDLIILDLNLPRKDGREVLAELKEDPILKRIPVVVLTSSSANVDIMETYNLHANCFITKPIDLLDFYEVARVIDEFWLKVARLPRDLRA